MVNVGRALSVRVLVLGASSVAAIANIGVVYSALGIVDSGVYFTVTSLGQILMVWDFGLAMGVAMFAADVGVAKGLRRAAVKAMLSLSVYVTIATVALAWWLAEPIARNVLHQDSAVYYKTVVIAFGLAAATVLVQPIVRMHEGLGRTVTVQVCDGSRPLFVLAGSLIATSQDWQLIAFVTVWGLGSLAPGIVIAAISVLAWPKVESQRAGVSVRRLAAAGSGYQVATAGNSLNTMLDQAIISAALGPAAVMTYQALLRLVQLAKAFFGGFWLFYWPRMYKPSELEARRAEYKKAYLLLLICGGIAGLLGVAFGAAVVEFWLGPSINPGMLGFAAAGVLIMVYAAEVMPSAVASSSRQQYQKAGLSIASAIVNLPVGWALARSVGPAGPLVSTALCYGALYVLPLHVIAHRRMRAVLSDVSSGSVTR